MAANGVAVNIPDDEEEFLDDVEAYMKRRGVPFDRNGKVAGRPAPLHKLYKLVMERGGYDEVTAGRMVWREIARNFTFPAAHEGAMSYQLKLLYYKNLAAYEIENHWHETPPPPEILEQQTAKGGDLRKRTRENFQINTSRNLNYTEDDDMDSEGDLSQQTPKKENPEFEEPGSGNRYSSRLRHQPKTTQVYQPDPTPSRQSRPPRATDSPQASAATGPTPANMSSNPRDPSFRLESYEPRQPIPLTLRPVMTPGSNSEVFYQRKALARAPPPPPRINFPQDLLRFTLPPSHFQGPNIYVRCVQGLKSGIREEEDFALHHLVKVSHERGDKFKFEGFPTLAESLLEKTLEITQAAWGVTFQVSHTDARGKSPPNTLNAVFGTENLAQKLAELPVLLDQTEIEPQGYSTRLEKLNEALLVVRNMVTLEENALFLSKMALFRDLITIGLNLPDQSRFSEFRQYCLDMAEMVTRHWDLPHGDDLYASLVHQLDSDDRGKVLAALRAIYRFDAEADRIHPITDVPIATIERLVQFCLLEDDDLVEATINFLYAYSAFSDNVSLVMRLSPDLLPNIVPRLTTLFLNQAIIHDENIYRPDTAVQQAGAPPTVPVIPAELYTQLLGYQEPDRSARWLRCCYEESAHDDVTQISIWQAYSQRFTHNQPIPAADFIKNVSSTLNGAQAQVVPGPQGQQRFIIKGVRPRRVLLNLQGQPYFRCHWETAAAPSPTISTGAQAPQAQTCGTWHSSREGLWKHILQDHSSVPTNADGQFSIEETKVPDGGFTCKWINCRKNIKLETVMDLGRHIKMHIPQTAEEGKEIIYKLAGEIPRPKIDGDRVMKHSFYITAVDQFNHPCGIPFMSCLFLCNLARYIGRYGGNEQQRVQQMTRMFDSRTRDTLWDLFSRHKTIAKLILDLLDLIKKGEAPAQKPREQHQDVDMEMG